MDSWAGLLFHAVDSANLLVILGDIRIFEENGENYPEGNVDSEKYRQILVWLLHYLERGRDFKNLICTQSKSSQFLRVQLVRTGIW